jgi:ADP-heptose:LPS heptosyltransferase
MDSSRLKRIDKYLGTFLVLVLAALEWVRRLVSPARRRAGTDLTHLKRIAVIKTVAIGDVLQALPTVKAIRERFPDARIELITTPRVREVVEGIPFVDEIVYYDVFGKHSGIGGVWRFARELRARRYDAWIELEHYYRFTTVIGWYTGAKVRVGFAIPGQVRRFLFTIGAPYPTDAHELDSFLSIARTLGAVVEHPSPVPVPTSAEDERVTRAWIEVARAGLPPQQRGQGLVVLHTTTSPVSIGRRWMDERWVELADRIAERYGLTAVWTGAPEDLPGLQRLAALTAQPSLVSAGALTLRQFAVLARLAELVVSVDTGPLHVAAATGTPTVAMFGPSDLRKWRPYGPGNAAMSAGLACSPCTTHYMGKISLKTCDDCMRAISVDQVLDAIESLPEGPPHVGRKDEVT